MRASLKYFLLHMLLLPSSAIAFDDAAIIRACDAEWGNNFQMVKFCRDQQRRAGRAFDDLKEKSRSNDLGDIILQRCTAEWGTNYQMAVFCFQQQADAVRELESNPEGIPDDIARGIRRDCENDWDTNFQMVAFCIEQQAEAWRSLQ